MSSRKTSTTAYGVVCGLDKLARMPQWRGYFSDEMLHLNTAFTRHAKDSPLKQAMDWLPPWLFIRLLDFIFIPGMVHHYLFRKRLIENQLVGAVESGVRQVIVLGAGLDTLAVRMARKYCIVQFFEIDLPNTQQRKLNIFSSIRHPIPPNCRFVEADLALVPLNTALQCEPGFKSDDPTLVILEGVLMYLTESEVKSLFASMRESFAGSLMVLFGAMVASDDAGNWRLRMVNSLLGKGQEATNWHCPSEVMPRFMADLGYQLIKWMPYKKLQSHFRGEREIQALPDEDENYYVVAKMPPFPANMPNLDIGKTSLISV